MSMWSSRLATSGTGQMWFSIQLCQHHQPDMGPLQVGLFSARFVCTMLVAKFPQLQWMLVDYLLALSDPFSTQVVTPQLWLSSSCQFSSVGCMEGLQRQLQAEMISVGAVNLILASWQDKINSTYNSAWHQWENWCSSQSFDTFSAHMLISSTVWQKGLKQERNTDPLVAIGLQYHPLICQYRILLSVDPLVLRLLKGGFNPWPPQPKYSSVWDVRKNLSFLR